MRRLTLTLSVFLALILSGCVHSGERARFTLPDLPPDLRGCFTKMTPAPRSGSLSKREVLQLVAKLRRSERSKTLCGRRLLAFYDTLRETD